MLRLFLPTRRHIKDLLRILNIQREVTLHNANVIGVKAVAEQRSNKHPEFLQETMFQEHGTRVLITNPAADKYLAMARENKIKEKYPQWDTEEESEES